jgi:NADH-quinone oxidoreductase subunit L
LGAYSVAVFHVITHAFFKACLFLGSGSVIHGLHGEQDMRKMGGLRKAMPITFWTMMISTLAIAGIFPFAGFWSKDEILMVAFEDNKILWIVASIASIMTAFYMFRLMYLTFFKEFRGTSEQKHHLHESPSLITIPLVILAILALFGGAINVPGSYWLNHFLEPILATKHEAHHLGPQEYMLMGIALTGAVLGIIWAYAKYIKQSLVPKEDAEMDGFSKTVYNKYYVDEFYMFLIVNPVNSLANFFRTTLEPALGKVVFSFGTLANGIGTQGKKWHTGSIGLYLFVFVIGIVAIVSYLFIAQ